jgi:hypothetical protein
MTAAEWWAEFDFHKAQSDRLSGASRPGARSGRFSGPDWDAARARHKAKKMKAPQT